MNPQPAGIRYLTYSKTLEDNTLISLLTQKRQIKIKQRKNKRSTKRKSESRTYPVDRLS